MSAMINTFGYRDASGVLRIDISVVDSLYRNAQLPSKTVLMSRFEFVVDDLLFYS
jgi:hypothetical protein